MSYIFLSFFNIFYLYHYISVCVCKYFIVFHYTSGFCMLTSTLPKPWFTRWAAKNQQAEKILLRQEHTVRVEWSSRNMWEPMSLWSFQHHKLSVACFKSEDADMVASTFEFKATPGHAWNSASQSPWFLEFGGGGKTNIVMRQAVTKPRFFCIHGNLRVPLPCHATPQKTCKQLSP